MIKRSRIFIFDLLGLSLVIAIITPLVLYFYSLTLINEKPKKILAKEFNCESLEKIWNDKETGTWKQCSSITPYWIYRWILVAIINDYIISIDSKILSNNISVMASQIAINHLRQGNFRGKGMLWWHLTNMSLCIWIQRNWMACEIVAKYKTVIQHN